jgi:hypothetical protein
MDLLISLFDEEDLVAMLAANVIPHASAGAFTVRWPIGELILEGCTSEQVDSLIQQFDRVINRLAECVYRLGYERASYDAQERARAASLSAVNENAGGSKPKKTNTGKRKK